MTDDQYALTLAVFESGEARDRMRGATKLILDLESAYERAVINAAETEAFYRMKRADAFRAHRDTGAPVDAAGTLARGECAPEKQAAMEAAGMLRLAGEKLENARDTRRSLWRLVEWARERDLRAPAQGRLPENAPAERWP